VALASNDPDAEQHAQEAERLTRHPHARNLRARALCGLGTIRRRQHDLQRAEAAYRAAIPAAQEPDDQRTARWSLARTLRLQGRSHDALEQLHSAISQTPTDLHHPIHIELAVTWLTLNQPERAQRALETSQHLYDRHADLAQIIQAELHRRQGHGIQALQALEHTNLRTPLAQEEARMWPELFALAHLAGRDVPTPTQPGLQPNPNATVEINACGLLRVLVNQRPVHLNPTGRPAELLVLMMEHHGRAPVETLIDQLWPKETNPKHKTQALWQLAKKLRHALGWPESISIQGKVYTLDEHATWHYDARTARHQQQAKTRFLEGIHSDWALEVARELENLQPSRQPNHQPNHLN
jgi:tetratricopeptide (TPR) repeat protein